MRGDQLVRQWRIIRAIGASTNGLAVAEIDKWEETGMRTIYRDLEAGFPVHTEKVDLANRWAFFDKSKFKISPPFTASHLISHYFCKNLVWVLRRIFSNDSIHSLLKKSNTLFSPRALSNLGRIQSVFHLKVKPYKDYTQFRGNGYNGSSL